MSELTCRLCLNKINNLSFISLNNNDDYAIEVKQALVQFLPDFDPYLVQQSLVCITCIHSLNTSSKFKTQCLQSDIRIRDYIKYSKIKCELATLNNFHQYLTATNVDIKSESRTQNTVVESVNVQVKQEYSDCNDVEFCNINLNTYKLESNYQDEAVFKSTVNVVKEPSCGFDEQFKIEGEEWISSEEAFKEILTGQNKEEDNSTVPDFANIVYKKYFSCKFCNYKTPLISSLEKHIKNHSTIKIFECANCDYKATKRINLYKHMRVHTGEKPYKCDFCDYKTTETSNLRTHIKIHTGEKPFECKICNHKFLRKADLQNHIKVHTGDKRFECEYCDRRFIRNVDLKLHKRVHTGERPFECDICKKRFSTRTRHNTHMMVHRNERPYECLVCNLKFSDKSTLKGHERTHMDRKPYECDLCDYKCIRKGNLLSHKRTHTGEKPFECKTCDYKTSYREHLNRHMRVHGEGKSFQCEVCDFKTSYRQSLMKHMKNHVIIKEIIENESEILQNDQV